MKRHLFFVICFLCSLTTFSQTIDFNENRIEPSNNIFKLSYGPAVMLSDFVEWDGKIYRNASMLNLSFDYEHVWNNGFGFGINASQNHCSKGNFNVFYVGPSLVYNRTTKRGFRLDAAFGIGYAANDLDIVKSRNGVGTFASFSLDYMFTKHIGLGAEVREMVTTYRKPKGGVFDKYEGRYGIDWIGISLGVRYCF